MHVVVLNEVDHYNNEDFRQQKNSYLALTPVFAYSLNNPARLLAQRADASHCIK